VRRYIAKLTGLSRAQRMRSIARYTATGRVQATAYRRRRFPQRYTRADIELLASVDEAQEMLSGPAIHTTDQDLSVGTPGWLPFPSLIFITCATASATASGFSTTQRRGPRQARSASGASHNRKVSRAFCAWIRCIKATSRRPGASITSTSSIGFLHSVGEQHRQA
jgi:hypothetical protein